MLTDKILRQIIASAFIKAAERNISAYGFEILAMLYWNRALPTPNDNSNQAKEIERLYKAGYLSSYLQGRNKLYGLSGNGIGVLNEICDDILIGYRDIKTKPLIDFEEDKDTED